MKAQHPDQWEEMQLLLEVKANVKLRLWRKEQVGEERLNKEEEGQLLSKPEDLLEIEEEEHEEIDEGEEDEEEEGVEEDEEEKEESQLQPTHSMLN